MGKHNAPAIVAQPNSASPAIAITSRAYQRVSTNSLTVKHGAEMAWNRRVKGRITAQMKGEGTWMDEDDRPRLRPGRVSIL